MEDREAFEEIQAEGGLTSAHPSGTVLSLRFSFLLKSRADSPSSFCFVFFLFSIQTDRKQRG